jgi:20S proteasome alpha/beta subunit
MTLIAGVSCNDGFLIAADSAVTAGEIIYHGEKLFIYQSDECRVLAALCGDIPFATMAWEQIKEGVARGPVQQLCS